MTPLAYQFKQNKKVKILTPDDLTIKNGFTFNTSNIIKNEIKKIGNLVTINLIINKTGGIGNETETILTLPEGFRPMSYMLANAFALLYAGWNTSGIFCWSQLTPGGDITVRAPDGKDNQITTIAINAVFISN